MNDFETAKQFFIEGLKDLEANNLQAAEINLARSLELVPERVSTLNNLSAVKIKLGKFDEAEQLVLKALAIENSSPESWSNLATALRASGRCPEALEACERALACNSSYALAWLAKAVTLSALARSVDALAACDEALKLDPSKYEFLYQKSLILKELNRLEEAQTNYRHALQLRVASSPVFIGERHLTQKAEILIVNQNPRLDGAFTSFEDLSRCCSNFPGQLSEQLRADFHFNSVFIGDALKSSARKQIPQPDVVINNHVNGEVLAAEGNLSAFNQLLGSFGVPVVNPPSQAIPTIRDLSAKLLVGIQNLLVPKTLRFSSTGKTPGTLAGEIADQFDYPLITRTVASQEGQGMNKVDSREELIRILSADDRPEKFFVTQFVDSRGENNFFRKIRAAVVKDEIIIVRVDHDHIWKIYARKSDERVAFYRENASLLDAEEKIIKDPQAALGQPAMQALHAIRQRIPLDVFGIDFDVDSNGRLVFYEANATMNLFSTARKEIPYPKEADERLKQAFVNYFGALVRRAQDLKIQVAHG